MRLSRLDLTRYGRFTDHRLDFGTASQMDGTDLHVVYGPNEAGKSTLLAAVLDLLFGIEARSRYNFLHPYASMQIGAALECEGRTQELIRFKKARGSLVDIAGRAVDEGLILSGLSGIDRNAYRTMFSLDDETLEQGGESILASKGDLGQLLFSASAGLGHLSQSLLDLRGEADGFYRHRARSGILVDLKARLADLKEQRGRLDTAAATHATLVQERDSAKALYEEALAERAATKSRLDAVQNLLIALPRLAELNEIRAQLDLLSALPEPPASWHDECAGLVEDDVKLYTRQGAQAEEIQRLSHEYEQILADDRGLSLADRVARLAERRARFMTAEKDLPERRLQLNEISSAIRGMLRRLDVPDDTDPTQLVLPSSLVGTLRDLIESRSGIEAALRSAKQEQERSEARRRHIEELIAREGSSLARLQDSAFQTAIVTLDTILDLCRSTDLEDRQRKCERSAKACLEDLHAQLASLLPWQGEPGALAGMRIVDAATLDEWAVALAAAEKERDRNLLDAESLTTARDRLQAEIEAMARTSGLGGEPSMEATRHARDEAWAAHLARLDGSTAERFHAALVKNDQAVAIQLAQSNTRARLMEATHSLARVEAELKRSHELAAAAEARTQVLGMKTGEAIAAMSSSLPPQMTIAQLKDWLARRSNALLAVERHRSADHEHQEAQNRYRIVHARLCTALQEIGVSFQAKASLDALVAQGQAERERIRRVQTLAAQREEQERECSSRRSELIRARQAEAAWQSEWTASCGQCWLGEGGTIPGVAAVRETLNEIAELRPALEKQASMSDRIRKMDQDRLEFEQEVASIADELEMEMDPAPLVTADRIMARISRAQATSTARAAKQAELREAEERARKLNLDIATHERRKRSMTDLFGVTDLAEVGHKLLATARRSELSHKRAQIEREIQERLATAGQAGDPCALETADRTGLEREACELEARFADLDLRSRELFATLSKAVDAVEAIGGDAAVARIEEERSTVLLEIEEQAYRYLRLRAGIAAAGEALRLYRDNHRSSMLERASEAFCTISRGNYSGLATRPDRDTEVLIAVSADGGSKVASELSKGTRFQLYLALRVAGYHEITQSRQPVPFIADDIMETFDDLRAEEAFRLFADMAQCGQVIYLTHHRHLCDIARQVCPRATIHELAPLRASASVPQVAAA